MAGVGPNECWLSVEHRHCNFVINPSKHDFVDRHTSKPLFFNVFWLLFQIFESFSIKKLKMAQQPPKMAQVGPRWCRSWPQNGPRWPEMAQDGRKMASRWPQDGPKWPQDGPRWPQDGPRWPKMAQDGPRMAPKMAPSDVIVRRRPRQKWIARRGTVQS